VDNRLYFKQLLSGRDFACNDQMTNQMVNFVYLIGDRETRECVIVDPAYAVNEISDIVLSDDMILVGALGTHYHPDHVGGKMMGWNIEGIS
jgi:glyoxylase-like metal-dependent hydrolase (beta-lactamase superfamily II)